MMNLSIQQYRDKYPYSTDCVKLEKTIGQLRNLKSYYVTKLNSTEINKITQRLNELETFYNKNTCDVVLGNLKLQKVDEIAEKYNAISKIRIETESKIEANKRKIVGTAIVLAGLGVLLIATKILK